MSSSRHADLAVKPFAVRAMLTAPQKEAMYVLREGIQREEEGERGYALIPTEQDVVIRAIALLCRKQKIVWPSDPRKSKGNPPRRPEVFDVKRLYSVRATLTEGQKSALEALREALQRSSEKRTGHANLPTEQETVIRALSDLARARHVDWPTTPTGTPRLVPEAPTSKSAVDPAPIPTRVSP